MQASRWRSLQDIPQISRQADNAQHELSEHHFCATTNKLELRTTRDAFLYTLGVLWFDTKTSNQKNSSGKTPKFFQKFGKFQTCDLEFVHGLESELNCPSQHLSQSLPNFPVWWGDVDSFPGAYSTYGFSSCIIYGLHVLFFLGAPSTKANIQPERGSATTSVQQRSSGSRGSTGKTCRIINDRMPTMEQHLRSSKKWDQRIKEKIQSERLCRFTTFCFVYIIDLGPCQVHSKISGFHEGWKP